MLITLDIVSGCGNTRRNTMDEVENKITTFEANSNILTPDNKGPPPEGICNLTALPDKVVSQDNSVSSRYPSCDLLL